MAAGFAFLASIIAASVSVYNARFAHFAQKHWWERKVDAYSTIIEALSSLVYYYDLILEAELEHRKLSEARRKEIDDHWRKGYSEVKKATATGAFLISTEAEAALQEMWKAKDKNIHPNDLVWSFRV